MAVLMTTSGTQSTVTFDDLGGREFSHPVVAYDISSEYDLEELRDSIDFQNAITWGWITITDGIGTPITDLSNIDDNQEGVDVKYTPAVSGEWTVIPTNVKGALDEISARTKLIEGGGGVDTDAQQASASVEVSSTSTVYVDMPDMTLTTNNSIDRKYLVLFSATFTGGSNKILDIEIIVDDVPAAASIRQHKISSNSAELTIGTQFLTNALATAKVIKVQWKISSGTVNVTDRSLIIYSIEGQ